jgi:hypothetical protein
MLLIESKMLPLATDTLQIVILERLKKGIDDRTEEQFHFFDL